MTPESLIVRSTLGEGREVPAALQGLPTEIDGQPVKYRRKALLKAGKYIHPKYGEYVFTRADLETCAKHTREWIADGYKPYLPPGHRLEYDKALNYGWLLDPAVEGDTLYGTTQLIGADAHREAARNDVSVFIRANALAPNGKKHALLLEHVALCPNPVAGNLGGFVPMSRDGAAPEEVPVYQMSLTAAPAARKDAMDLTALRKALGLADGTADADVLTKATERATAFGTLEGEKTAALSRATTAEQERDGLKTKVAAFSRDGVTKQEPAPPTSSELFWAKKAVETARAEAMQSGLSPATCDKIESRFVGTDTKIFTLSRETSADDRRALNGMALALDVYEAIKGNVPPPATGEDKAFALSRSTGGGDTDKELTPEQKQKAVEAELAQTGLGRRVLAARKSA